MLEPKSESATGTGAGADTNGARPEVAGVGASADSAPVGSDELVSGGGGNRWPRQETLALLQIRSDMDGVFRDSSHKGPLWDEISRKMAEMGYRRSAKKCREKFENVYKYHRRTKDGRSGKSDGKTYRFFDQLEALESNHSSSSSYFLPPPEAAVPIAMAMPPPRPPPPLPTPVTTPAPVQNASYKTPMSFPSSPSGTPSSSSMSTSSDEEVTGTRSRRKRKWKDFFEKLTKDVVAKQEEFERKFLEAIDKREGERRAREEAWKAQEMARLKREHEILVHERSMVSAKESALLSFLQKLSDHQQIPLPPSILHPHPIPPPPPTTPTFHSPILVPIVPISEKTTTPVSTPATTQAMAMQVDSGGDRSASRWPKEEIEALIRLRTNMEHKYQEGVPKGPLWEEISSAMRSQGYNRNPKRCKEKWENINKYYRKVKESNKKRRVDSKTCPYYYQLEALYSAKLPVPPPNDEVNDVDDDDDDDGGYEIAGNSSSINGGDGVKSGC